MQAKFIKKRIKKDIDLWLDSIEDSQLVKMIERDLVVTGGCITSAVLNEPIKDFDCYFKTKETVLAVCNYYVDKWNTRTGSDLFVLDCDNAANCNRQFVHKFDSGRVKIIYKSAGVAVDNSDSESDKGENKIEKYDPIFISSNAITLKGKIQVICRFYGNPDKIHDTYDFEHTKAYYTYADDTLVIPTSVYDAIINKVLIYTGSKYPVCSLFRVRKFLNRGWTINAGQLLKMALQISELDLLDVDVLEDQLIGVDTIYFTNLIDMIRNEKKKDNFELSSGYVIDLINKIF